MFVAFVLLVKEWTSITRANKSETGGRISKGGVFRIIYMSEVYYMILHGLGHIKPDLLICLQLDRLFLIHLSSNNSQLMYILLDDVANEKADA